MLLLLDSGEGENKAQLSAAESKRHPHVTLELQLIFETPKNSARKMRFF